MCKFVRVSGPALANHMLPLEIFVAPGKVLFPERERLLVPFLVSATGPLPFWISFKNEEF